MIQLMFMWLMIMILLMISSYRQVKKILLDVIGGI
uniref:Uncharacterized protein n=1 Tax=Siphoviridae sp. ctxMM9 TaxID=2827973 RepID=A0A8S5T698_9CAUD|nr:MAG TPA: hypothetical protein [Siphoviridae sp. ctxMM9]